MVETDSVERNTNIYKDSATLKAKAKHLCSLSHPGSLIISLYFGYIQGCYLSLSHDLFLPKAYFYQSKAVPKLPERSASVNRRYFENGSTPFVTDSCRC